MPEQTDDDQPTPFADWLMRTARGLGYATDAALAKALGVQQSTVSRWQKRSTSKPSIEQLLKISTVFGVEIEPLLVLSGHVPPDAVRRTGASEVPSAVSAAERLIADSDLPEPVQEIVRRYWQARLKEEHERLADLIDAVAEAQASDKVSADARQRTALLFETNTPAHIAGLLKDCHQAYDDLKRKPARTRK